MREVLRCNDPVVLNFAQAVLRDAGIAHFLADQHISLAEGSIGAFPRRLQVEAKDLERARQVLQDAGLDAWLVGDGAA